LADNTVLHIGGNSPEHVAFKLMNEIASVEGKVFHTSPGQRRTAADCRWILSTYRECLMTVKSYETRNNKVSDQ
jgi:hypothetical protein